MVLSLIRYWKERLLKVSPKLQKLNNHINLKQTKNEYISTYNFIIPVAKKRSVTDSLSIGFKHNRILVSFFSISDETNFKTSSNESLSSL